MATRWVIVCAEHTTGPFRTREAAARRLAAIEAAGHCQETHTITEVAR